VATFHRSAVGACGFLDVLEEAALRRYRVILGLADGSEIEDVIVGVVTERGADWIVLERHSRVDATSIAWLSHVDETRFT